MRLSRWIAPICAATICSPSAGQQPPDRNAQSDDAIVVTGVAEDAEARRQLAVSFVKGIGVLEGERPAARWKDPVCPRVTGLSAAHAAIVEARLRLVAREIGVPLAERSPCRPNVVVSFVADAAAVARQIASRRSRYFAAMPAARREALLGGNAPLRWWYTSDIRGRDNDPAATSPATFAFGNAEGGGSILPDMGQSVQSHGASFVSTQAIRVLTSATVLVDVGAAEGRSLNTVADYAALVAFAELAGDGFAPAHSILGAFAADGPRAMTEWDKAFLRALYRLPLDRRARLQRYKLVDDLTRSAATVRR